MKLRPLFAVLAVLLAPAAGHAALRTVALTGQQAPGAPAGSNFIQLTSVPSVPVAPPINDEGRVSFAGGSQISGGAVSRGVWSEATGTLAAVVREGTAAPGAGGSTYQSFNNPVMGDLGRIAFDGTLNAVGSANAGIWSEGASGLSLVARRGSAAPGTGAGVNFTNLFPPSVNDSGATAFRAAVNGTGVTAANDDGVWAEKAGGLTLMARGGGSAPDTAAGVVFESFPNTPILINAAGQIAFRAFLTGSGVTTANDVGIWTERGGAVRLVAREGGAVPRITGATFSFIGDPVLNSNGQTAFAGLMAGAPVTTNAAIFSEGVGTLAIAARKGNAAPGTAAGVTFNGFGSPLLNVDGQVAFTATLAGTGVSLANDSGVWTQRSGELTLAAREGDQAPGVAAGLSFSTFTNPVFNSAGQLAFTATLAGAGVVPGNDTGLWVQGLGGDLRFVAREGDQLEVSPGVSRTIADLLFAGNANTEDGRRAGMNDLGEVAFLATFTDGSSGIFVSDVAQASPGDFDGDDDIDGADLLVWQRGLGRVGTGLPNNGDANADGDVNSADLAVWQNNFGGVMASPAAMAVPEPAATLLAAAAAACLIGASRPRTA